MSTNNDNTKAAPALTAAAGYAVLDWRKHPDEPYMLQGYLRSRPETTLFIIEVRADNRERGRLLGAFIPDEVERSDDTEGLIYWLKASAESYMCEWVDDFNSHTTEVRDASPHATNNSEG